MNTSTCASRPALHASDNQDRGGNCIPVSLGGARTTNLHTYWDTGMLEPLGTDPKAIAAELEERITPAERGAWVKGDARTWAGDSYKVARNVAYTIGSPSGCASDRAPIALSASYQVKAQATAAVQLEKAGARLAAVLNHELGS